MCWILKYTKVRNVKSPERWTKHSSGIDFFIPNILLMKDIKNTPSEDIKPINSIIRDGNIYINSGEWILIPSWIKTIIKSWYDLVFDNKSWITVKKWLIIWAKVIDADYRWEIHLHLINTSSFAQKIKLWDKIAQAIIRKVILWDIKNISKDKFEEYSKTERWEGWFWSTGEK